MKTSVSSYFLFDHTVNNLMHTSIGLVKIGLNLSISGSMKLTIMSISLDSFKFEPSKPKINKKLNLKDQLISSGGNRTTNRR